MASPPVSVNPEPRLESLCRRLADVKSVRIEDETNVLSIKETVTKLDTEASSPLYFPTIVLSQSARALVPTTPARSPYVYHDREVKVELPSSSPVFALDFRYVDEGADGVDVLIRDVSLYCGGW
ncbi:hypothetical protein FZEAL_1786 [Fusarium zealandicum]|uniref:Uncharacterized protein n=1 Tax=Fusarium zealandicum TaxID=1053134 RepID=A0A8H4XNF6_9HYPO|nr:hypothetical protein FZEAL_1786 [Fusarium zealandicum]